MAESKKASHIQGIRAIACISIALVHFFTVFFQYGNIFITSGAKRFIFAPFFGDIGVVFFSVIAGWLAMSYNKKHSDNLSEYLVKRYTKFWSAVFISGIILYLELWISQKIGFNIIKELKDLIFDQDEYKTLFYYIINSIFINDRILGSFWPLLSIFIGTVVISVTDKHSTNNTQRLVVLLTMLAFAYLLNNRVLACVYIGGIYGLYEDSKIINKLKNSFWKYPIFIIAWFILSYNSNSLLKKFIVTAIGAIIFVSLRKDIKPINRILSSKVLVHLGDLSFAIYCTHAIVMIFMCIVLKALGIKEVVNITEISVMVLLPIYFILVYAASLLFQKLLVSLSKFVEVYSIKLHNIVKSTINKFRDSLDKEDTYLFIAIGVLFIFLSSYIVNSSMRTEGYLGVFSMDYTAHNGVADTVFDGMDFAITKYFRVIYTYPLYHVTTKIISVLTGFSIHFSSSIAICLYIFLTIMFVRKYLLYYNKSTSKKIINAVSFTSVLLMNLYMPSITGNLFYPQGAPNLWHNPTILTSRPFAMLSTFLFIKFFEKEDISKKDWLYAMLALFVCELAKPNFATVFYPISGIMILVKYLKNPKKNYKHLLYWIIIILPSFCLNLHQHSNMFLHERTWGGLINFAYITRENLAIYVLVFAFPIFMLVTEGYKKYKDNLYILVWGIALLGLAEYSIITVGDIIWGFEMSLFMLFVYSAKLLFIDSNNKKTKIIGTSIWIAQTIIGIFYFATGILGSHLIY